MVTKWDFLEKEALLWLNEKSRVSLKVGCLPYAVGKQPSIPCLILEKNGRNADDDDDDGGKISTTAGEVSSS